MNSRRRPEQTGFEISRKRPPSKLDLRFPESAPSRLDSRFPESAPSRLDSTFPKAPRADWIRDSKKCPERILSGSFLKCQMLSAKHGSKTLVPRGRGSFHPKTQGFCNIDFLESAPSKSFGAFSGVASGVGAAEVRGRTSFQTNSDSQTAKNLPTVAGIQLAFLGLRSMVPIHGFPVRVALFFFQARLSANLSF